MSRTNIKRKFGGGGSMFVIQCEISPRKVAALTGWRGEKSIGEGKRLSSMDFIPQKGCIIKAEVRVFSFNTGGRLEGEGKYHRLSGMDRAGD